MVVTDNPTAFTASDAREVCEMLEKCRDVLLIGLTSYGEIERLSDAQEREAVRGSEIPKNLQVIHPTGDSGTVSDFAEALTRIDIVMRKMRLAGAELTDKAAA